MYRVIVKRIQRARYEQGLLALARAYVGYDIDFPAFAKESEMSYRRPNLGDPRCLHFMYPSLLVFGVSIVRCTTL